MQKWERPKYFCCLWWSRWRQDKNHCHGDRKGPWDLVATVNEHVRTHIKVRTEKRNRAGEREFQTDEAAHAEGQPQLRGHEDGMGRNTWVGSNGMMDTRLERQGGEGPRRGFEKTRMLNINRIQTLTVSQWHNYGCYIVLVWKDATSVLKVLGYKDWGTKLKEINSMNGGRKWQNYEWWCRWSRLLMN